MKIRLGDNEYEGQLDAAKIIRVEKETGRSFLTNTKDPSITFVCSMIAAAVSSDVKTITVEQVAECFDLKDLGYYTQIVSSLMSEAFDGSISSVLDNVKNLR